MIEPATVSGSNRTSPADLEPTEVIELLAAHGAVVFTGFDCPPEQFRALTDIYGRRTTVDPNKVSDDWTVGAGRGLAPILRRARRAASRIPVPGRAAPADDGTRYAPFDAGVGINPHNENTFIPDACPDVVWFLCQHPAQDGGATIVVDGIELLATAPEAARTFLEDISLRFELSLGFDRWRDVYGETSADRLRARLAERDDVEFHLTPGGGLEYVFDVPQVASTFFAGEPAAKTNVLSRRPYDDVGDDEPERTTTGEPIAASVVRQLLDTCAAIGAPVALGPGDVLMLDNSRVMHGREPYRDLGRRVLTRCTWLDRHLLDAPRG